MLASEFEQEYFKKLEETMATEYAAGKEIFPPKDLIFNAFNLTPFNKVWHFTTYKLLTKLPNIDAFT